MQEIKEAVDGAELDAVLDQLELNAVRDTIARDLSAGDRRRLCLAMALVGRSRIVFLDEPTSGMDPAQRKQLLDLLPSLRGNVLRGQRCVVLSTHHLDESDRLADRIAVLREGTVQDVGTSAYLKKRYGPGYSLTLTPNRNSGEPFTEDEISSCENCLRSALPEALPDGTSSPYQQKWILPGGRARDRYAALIERLEELGVARIALDCNSLEETILKMRVEGEEQQQQ